MRELERQQKEAEENADRVFDMCTGKKLVLAVSHLIHKTIIKLKKNYFS